MGLLSTRWEARYEGHLITVHRNEVTRGFAVEVDGTEVGRKGWSLVGTGAIDGAFASGDRRIPITVKLKFSFVRATCIVLIDGAPISVAQVA